MRYGRLLRTGKPETAVEAAVPENEIGMFGIRSDSEDSLTYWIAGLYQGGVVPEGLELFTFPAGSWAVFKTRAPIHDAIQELNKFVWREWFPTEGKKLQADGISTLEVYSRGGMSFPVYCGISQGRILRRVREPRIMPVFIFS